MLTACLRRSHYVMVMYGVIETFICVILGVVANWYILLFKYEHMLEIDCQVNEAEILCAWQLWSACMNTAALLCSCMCIYTVYRVSLHVCFRMQYVRGRHGSALISTYVTDEGQRMKMNEWPRSFLPKEKQQLLRTLLLRSWCLYKLLIWATQA